MWDYIGARYDVGLWWWLLHIQEVALTIIM